MTNQEWTSLIAKEFHVSNTVAKNMLSAMMKIKRIKEYSSRSCNNCSNSFFCYKYDGCINKAGTCEDYERC